MEMKNISKILLIAHSDKIESELEKVATTDERKRIWILIDGKRTSQEIAVQIGISKRSVDRFLRLAENIGFVKNPWGKPAYRTVDYVPSKWVERLSLEKDEEHENNER